MSLSNYKLTDAAVAESGVVAAPDKLTGTAAQNKSVFDRLVREAVKPLYNGLIDALGGTGGAEEIGLDVEGLTADNVAAALSELLAGQGALTAEDIGIDTTFGQMDPTDVDDALHQIDEGFQLKLTFDTTPTAGSANPVTSGGVRTALDRLYVKAGQKSDTTLGAYATAEGEDTTASGTRAHAEGHNTNATADSAHAEGMGTTASVGAAHAEGYFTAARDMFAHAEGQNTVASGAASHTEGTRTTASGPNSHAEGQNTIANHRNQHVFGAYNVADASTESALSRGDYIEIVGNGTASNACSNARTLDWDGNEVLAGRLTLGAAPTNNMDAATKKYVDDAIAAAIAALGT